MKNLFIIISTLLFNFNILFAPPLSECEKTYLDKKEKIEFISKIDSILNKISYKTNNKYFNLMTFYKDDIKEIVLKYIPIRSPLSTNNIIKISDVYQFRPYHPITHLPAMHYGIDFSCEMNTPICATADGIVVRSKYQLFGYGKYIEIKHQNGLSTIYAHLDSATVETGQQILSGQIIGLSGETGRATGPHLHYEIRYEDEPINPYDIYFDVKASNRNKTNYLKILKLLEEKNV